MTKLSNTESDLHPTRLRQKADSRLLTDLDLTICRSRVVLSLIVLASIYVDPTIGRTFVFERFQLPVLLAHLIYSVAACIACRYAVEPRLLLKATASLDVIFAMTFALLTEGVTSPAYVLFVFAIIAVGCQAGRTATVMVTIVSLIAYFSAIGFSTHGISNLYMMRAIYLAIVGYLIGFFGEQRAKFEARLHDLESAAERHTIARELHDGFVQSLAGVNLRLHLCREMLSRGEAQDTLTGLTELQKAVARDYDETRGYIQRLANIQGRAMSAIQSDGGEVAFEINAHFTARTTTTEQILQILLEGVRNAQKHGKAQAAHIDARTFGDVIRIAIEDNGVGLGSNRPPWTIASRVAELGGSLTVHSSEPTGTTIEIEMPAA